MSLDPQEAKELARLTAVYRDQPDSALLNLWDGRTSLTEVAQQALADVIQERGLEVELPADVLPEEPPPADEDSDEIAASEALLRSFSDTIDLNRVIESFKRAGVAWRIHDASVGQTATLGGMKAIDLWLIVAKKDEPRARSLMFKALGIEDAATPAPSSDPLNDLGLFGLFERDEARTLADAFIDAGVSFCWFDPSDDPEASGMEHVMIYVHGSSFERARELADKVLPQA